MKLKLLFLFLFLSSELLAQHRKSTIEVLNFKSSFITFYTNGEKEDFGQEIKIAFFKDYVLFERPTHHYKTSTMYIDFDNIKDGDTIMDESEPDMTVEKITYSYYIFQRGQQKGLVYDEGKGQTKHFFVDTLFEHTNLSQSNERSLSTDLGKPKEIKKVGKRIFEKYYGFKKEDGVDTIFRHYDEAMKEIDFSISKKLDQEKQSRLVKSLGIIKHKTSLEVNKPQFIKTEVLDEIELITPKVSKVQLEKFKRYFEKYEQDIIKWPMTN